MVKLEIKDNDNLNSIVYSLLSYDARGELAYCEFLGHKLYSNDVSMDSAYHEVYGMSKEDYYINLEEEREKQEVLDRLRQQKIDDSIPNWNFEGSKYIYKERIPEWISFIIVTKFNINSENNVNIVLEVMKLLDENISYDEIINKVGIDKIKENILSIATFSKYGTSFIRYVFGTKIKEDLEDRLKEIDKQNKLFANDFIRDEVYSTYLVDDSGKYIEPLCYPEDSNEYLKINELLEKYGGDKTTELLFDILSIMVSKEEEINTGKVSGITDIRFKASIEPFRSYDSCYSNNFSYSMDENDILTKIFLIRYNTSSFIPKSTDKDKVLIFDLEDLKYQLDNFRIKYNNLDIKSIISSNPIEGLEIIKKECNKSLEVI